MASGKDKNSKVEVEFERTLDFDFRDLEISGSVKSKVDIELARGWSISIEVSLGGSYDFDDEELGLNGGVKGEVKTPVAELEAEAAVDGKISPTETVTTGELKTRAKIGNDKVASLESKQEIKSTSVNGKRTELKQTTEITLKALDEVIVSAKEDIIENAGGTTTEVTFDGLGPDIVRGIRDAIDRSNDARDLDRPAGPGGPNPDDTLKDFPFPERYDIEVKELPGNVDYPGAEPGRGHPDFWDTDFGSPSGPSEGQNGRDSNEGTGGPGGGVVNDPDPGDGWGSPHDGMVPVVLDLNGDGDLSLVPISQSTALFDMDDDGYVESVGWVGAADGILVYDQNQSETVDHSDEIILSRFAGFEGATDLDGLATFDSNNDGVFDSQDEEFGAFRVWQDLDQDGESDDGELLTLTQRGIESINLEKVPVANEDPDQTGNKITNTTEFTRTDGSTHLVGDVSLLVGPFSTRFVEHGGGVVYDVLGLDWSIFFVSDGEVADIDADLEGYQTVIGNDGADRIRTDGEQFVSFIGFGGDDTLIGGSGGDRLAGGEGADSIAAGDGDDVLFIDSQDIFIDGGDGFDVAFSTDAVGISLDLQATAVEVAIGHDGNDTLDASGSGEATMLFGEVGNDRLIGSAHDDQLSGGEGADTLVGGAGNDLFIADHLDSIDGGDGIDQAVFIGSESINVNAASIGIETLVSDVGDDRIEAGTLSDESSIMISGGGKDTLLGGDGDDLLYGHDGDDSILGGAGKDDLLGGDGDDTLSGGADTDGLYGGLGNDNMAGGAGDDTLMGSEGDDTYHFGRGDGHDRIEDSDFELGAAYTNAIEERITYKYTEAVVTGGWRQRATKNDEKWEWRVRVSYRNKTVVEVDPQVETVERNEIISIDAGQDTLRFGQGVALSDLVLKLEGGDLIVALNDPSDPNRPFEELADRVTIKDWSKAFNRVETFAFDDGSSVDEQGILDLLATSGDDILAVESSVAELRGGAGNDSLTGGDSGETLVGGDGDDTLKGGNADDTYRFGRGDGADTVHDIGVVEVANGTEKVEFYQESGTFEYNMWDYYGGWKKRKAEGTYDARYYEVAIAYVDQAADGGARDVLQFGPGIHVHDLMLRQVGDDLIVGVGDRSNPSLTFEQLTDKITIKDWYLESTRPKGEAGYFSRVEIFDFEDGFTLDLAAIIAEVGQDAAALETWLQTAITVTPEGGYVVQGTAGDERFTGTQFADTLDGAAGDDLLVGKAGNDSLTGGTGNDSLDAGEGGDTLVGGSGNDSLDGGAGDDTLIGGSGADTLAGGDGQNDKAVFSGLIANHTIQLTAEGATVVDLTAAESASTNLLTGIETVEFDNRVIDLTGTTNNAPVAVDGFAQLPVDTTVTGKLKAWDLDGDHLTYSIETDAASGTAVVQADGSFIYTYDPNTGFEGFDSFVFKVDDGQGNTDTGTVSIEVFQDASIDNTAVGTAEVRANTHTANDQGSSDLAGLSDGRYVVVWRSKEQDGGSGGIFAQRYAADGTVLGGELAINQATAPDQFDPAITVLSDDSYVITWTSFDQNPGSNEIYARHFSPDGVALTDEFQVNTTTTLAQRLSSIAALTDGGFVVTWTDWAQEGVDNLGIYGQRYDAAAQAVGGEFHVSEEYSAGNQIGSQVVGLANGGFVVVWEAPDYSREIRARIYDPDGAPVTWEETVGNSSDFDDDDRNGDRPDQSDSDPGTTVVVRSEIEVNEQDYGGTQDGPSVAALAGGDFVIVWASDHNAGSWGVNGQRFSVTGERVGDPFDVNTTVVGAQHAASVAGLSDGSFVVAWVSWHQDGSGQGLYLQVFDPDGNKEGPEIQVNDTTTGDQTDVSITALDDGGFAVSWTSADQDDDVYTKTYTRKPHRNSFGYGPGDDAIVGTDKGNSLVGGGGDDFLTGAGGGDTIDGGIGQDLASFAGSGAAVAVDLSAGTAAGGDAEGDELTSIEHLLGSDYGDSLTGEQGDNTLIGGAGGDMLSGAEGADSLFGDAGDDSLSGDAGDDHLSGGEGVDTAVFSGRAVDYDIQINGNEATITDLRINGDGIDSLLNVERAQFADRVIHLDGTNNAPMTVDDSVETQEDHVLRLTPDDLLANDDDLEGDGIALTNVGAAVGGEVTTDQSGLIIFTPDKDFEGQASFSYTATDSQGASHTATAYVDVTPVNDAPVAINSVVRIESGTIAQGRATVEDIDLVDFHSFWIQSLPSNGTVQFSGDGLFEYLPKDGFVGDDRFEFQVWDSEGLSSLATIDIEVRPVDESADTLAGGAGNDVLMGGGGGDSLEGGAGDDVLEGGSGDDTLAGGADFDTAVFSGRVTDYQIALDGNQATVRDLRDGAPDGVDHLTDVERLWFRGDRAIYIDGRNNAPIATGAGALMPVDTVGNGRVSAWDFEGDALTFVLGEAPQNGTVTVDPSDGSYSYTPNAGYVGSDSFTVTVTAEDGSTDTAVVAVEVAPSPNGEPLLLLGSLGRDLLVGGDGDDVLEGGAEADDLDGGAGSDTASYESSSQGVSVDLELGNGTGGDAEGDRLVSIENVIGSAYDDSMAGNAGDNRIEGGAGRDSVTFNGNAADYSVDIQPDGVVVVTDLRPGREDGTDTLVDVEVLQFADRTLDLTSGDNAPVAVDGIATTPKDQAVSGVLTGWDVDGGVLTYQEVEDSAFGSVTIHPDGRYEFTPNSGFEGEASFTYSVTDDTNRTSTAKVTLHVGGDRIDSYVAQGETPVNSHTAGDQERAAVAALTDGGFVVVWDGDGADGQTSGIYAQRYNSMGEAVGTTIVANTITSDFQGYAAVAALADGGFVVTWQSDVDFDYTIRAQRYDADGTPLGGEVQVSPNSSRDHRRPQIVGLSDGGYLIVWEKDDISDELIFAQRFDSAGQAIGSAIEVVEADNADSEANPPVVAALADGGFVIAWQDAYGSDNAVLAQRYDAAGVAVGEPLAISGVTSFDQDSATIAGLRDGGFVVVWEAGSSLGEIDGKLYDADGNVVVDTFSVNSHTTGTQTNPSVTALDDGGFVVAWHSEVSGSYEIRGQRYDAAGVAVGGEFQLNEHTTGSQLNPAIAGLVDGGFVTAWRSFGQDGDGDGVFAQLHKPVFGGLTSSDGSAGADILVGGAQGDSLAGAGGSDTLVGGAGADSLDGGLGQDTASYEASTEAVQVDLAAVTAATGGDAAGDVLTNIENLIGSAQADHLIGDGQANRLEGGAGDDTLSGAGGDDTLVGGAGADSLDGGDGFDTAAYEASAAAVTVDLAAGTGSLGDAAGDSLANIEGVVGSSFDDSLSGNAVANRLLGLEGADSLQGAGGADVLDGGIGDDSLLGGADNDSLIGGAGADTLDGGAGTDVASYEGSTEAVTIDLGAGSASGGDATGDELIDVENLSGSAHSDSLTGNAEANRLSGWAGADTLSGAAGDDTLVGGSGGDSLSGGSGSDTASYEDAESAVSADLSGADGSGDAAGDSYSEIENLVGSAHDDTLSGDSIANVLKGMAGDDVLNGREGNDSLLGGEGADTLSGGIGADLLDGGADSDTASYEGSLAAVNVHLGTGVLSGGSAEGDTLVSIEGVAGSAYADTLTGSDYADTLAGRDGDDLLDGGAGDDALFGGAGEDTLVGGTGADLMEGGDGHDIATYEFSANGVSVDLESGLGTGGDADGDLLSGIEEIRGSNHDDTLAGDGLDNLLAGGGGADAIYGGFGDDTLLGGAGADTLEGGLGNDLVDYRQSSLAITIDLAAGTGTGGDADGDTLTEVESVGATAYDDVLLGNDQDNFFNGADGNDSLVGGLGFDTFVGGAGADTIDGGDGFDVVRYDNSSFGVNVDLAGGNGLGGDAEGDVLTGIEAAFGSAYGDTLVGSDSDNLLVGQDGDDVLSGAEGLDTLVGDAGADSIDGGAGDDTLIGGAGADSLVGGEGDHDLARYDLSESAVTIDLAAGTGSGGDAEGDVLGGIEHLIGSRFDDRLSGSAAQNDLIGGVGNDTLIGGAGADTLDGGFGTDTASYEGSTSAVRVDLSQGIGVGGDADGDTFYSVENLIGSSHDDTLRGDSGDNLIDGGAGMDTAVFAGVAEDYVVSIGENESGATEITVSARDGGGANGTDTLLGIQRLKFADKTIDLVSGNNVPVALPATVQFATYQSLGGQLEAWDADGDALSFAVVGGPANGSLVLNDAGRFTYTPDDGFRGSDSFTYIVTDAQGNNDTATVTLTPANAVPLVSADVVSTAEGTAVEIDVLANDSDLDGDAMAPVLDTQPTNGSVDLNPDGTFTYTPDANFAGDDSFTYKVNDGHGNSAAATVTVTVTPVQDAPVAVDDTVWADIDSAVVVDLLANDVDVDGDSLTAVPDAQPANGVLTSNPDGTFTYTPNAGYVGTDSFTYTLDDGQGGASSATVSITVSQVNGLFVGGSGDDSFDGLGGQDTLQGDRGDDTLIGGGDDDSLEGGRDDDRLDGGDGNDTLEGSYNNDTLIGGAGADSLDGGSGSDLASYKGSDSGVNVNLSSGAGTGGDAEGDTLVDIERLAGSEFDDTLTAGSSSDIFGLGGDDVLIGGSGSDDLSGGSGSDTLKGGWGSDTLLGGAGNDSLDGEDGNDLLDGGDGADTLKGGTGRDTLLGGTGNDSLEGGDGIDLLKGGDGDDTLKGGDDSDTLVGGAGADRLDGGSGWDTASYEGSSSAVFVDLGAGTAYGGHAEGDVLFSIDRLIGSDYGDTLVASSGGDRLTGGLGDDSLSGGSGRDTLVGGLGEDSLSGGDGNDVLDGDGGYDTLAAGSGNDTLTGGAGADNLDGGAGTDLASYEFSAEGVSVDLASGAVSGGDAQGDLIANIENLKGSSQADVLAGHDEANGIDGGGGADSIDGAGGSDTLLGGSGDDMLAGGKGDDRLFGGSGDDTVDGGEGDDTLDGGSGFNRLVGGTGTDTVVIDDNSTDFKVDVTAEGIVVSDLRAGAPDGVNTLVDVEVLKFDDRTFDLTGGGNAPIAIDDVATTDVDLSILIDVLANDSDVDGDFLTAVIATQAANGNVSANPDGTFTYTPNAGYTGADSFSYTLDDGQGNTRTAVVNLTISATDVLFDGGSGGDFFSALGGQDTVNGHGGNDTLLGGAGNDSLEGGGGDDFLDGGDDADTLEGGWENDTLLGGAGNDSLDGYFDNDFLDGGDGADTLQGGFGDDTLLGGAGNDSLEAHSGNDFLDGGDGADTLKGGNQNDTLLGGVDNDSLEGGDDYDLLEGGDGDDTLEGGDDSDTLVGGAGADRLDGGSGTDTASYEGSSAAVFVDLGAGTAYGGHAEGDVFISVGSLIGSDYGDTLVGSSGGNRLYGGMGDDSLSSGGGNDILAGDGGNDRLDGGTGTDIVDFEGRFVDYGIEVLADRIVVTDLRAGGTGGVDTLFNVEVLRFSDRSIDLVSGQNAPVAGSDTVTTSEDVAVEIDLRANDSDFDGDPLLIAVSQPANGTVMVNPDGTFTYTPNANFNGDDRFTYKLSDGKGGSDTATVTVTVTPVNDAPVVSGPVALSVAEDNPLTITQAQLLGNAVDADNDTLSVSGVIADSGNLVDNGDGTWTLTPAADFNGTVNLDYNVSDGIAAPVAATAAVTVTPENDAPVVSGPVALSTAEDNPLTITEAQLLGNATDAENDTLSVSGVIADSGNLVDNGDGTWTLTPDPDFNGTVTLNYSVSDGTATPVATTAAVTVTPENDAPVVSGPVALSTAEDTQLTITQAQLLGNAVDADNDTLSVSGVIADSGGLVDNGDGTWTLTPDPDFNGTVTLDYNVSDGIAAPVAATAAVTVTPENDAPVVSGPVALSTAEDTQLLITETQLLGNATDAENDTLSVSGVIADSGNLVDNGDGTWTLTPATDFVGTVNLDYSVSDGIAAPVAATAAVTVTAGGTLLVGTAGKDTLTGGAGDDTLEGGDDADFLYGEGGNDSLQGGFGSDRLYGGAGADTIDGGYQFDLIYGGDGDDSLLGGSQSDTLIGGAGADTLDGGWDADTASYTDSSEAVTIDLLGSAHGGDAEGDVFVSVENLVGSAFGDTLKGDGAANRLIGGAGDDSLSGGDGDDTLEGGVGADTLLGGVGSDAVSYVASSAAVNVNLLADTAGGGDATGDSLSGFDHAIGSDLNDTLTGNTAANNLFGLRGDDLLSGGDGNDSLRGDRNDDTLLGGAGADTLDGGRHDDLLNGGEGADSLIGGTGIDTATYVDSTVAVSVDLASGTGSGGHAQGDTLEEIEHLVGSAYNDTLSGDAGDNTLDGGAGAGDRAVFDGSASDYNVEVLADRVVVTDLRTGGGTDGTDTLFGIEVLQFADGTQSLSGNNAPLAGDDSVTTSEDSDVTIAVLTNDSDPDTTDSLSVQSFDTAGTTGLVTDNGDGTFNYNPNGQFESLAVGETATDSFSYTVSDGNGGTDTAVVTITINGANDGPTATADAATGFTTGENNLLTTASVLTNDSDPDSSDSLSVQSFDTTGTTGLVTDNGDGTFNYNPNAQFESLAVGETATDSFSYTVSDGNGGVDTATVTITITGANDDPTAADDSLSTALDTALSGQVLADNGSGADSDPDTNDSLSVSEVNGNAANVGAQVTLASGALLTLNANGTFDYDASGSTLAPTAGTPATDSFTYTLSDDQGGSDTATVTLTVTAAAAGSHITGTSGGDTLTGGAGDDTIDAGLGKDLLYGEGGNDILNGSSSRDTLIGGAGADTLDGGSGPDTASYTTSTAAVDIDLLANAATGGHAQDDVLISIEYLVGTAFNDTLTGDADTNLLVGGQGNDVLTGGDGVDSLEGGAGADSLIGGAGIDWAMYDTSSEAVAVNLLAGTGTAGDAVGDSYNSIENLEGSEFADTLTGDSNDNVISGWRGNDVLSGGAGNDSLSGSLGYDTLQGGDGADTLDGGSFNDSLTGGNGNDSLLGKRGQDTLLGGDGADTLSGGAIEDDTLSGGAGDDLYLLNLGDGQDVIDNQDAISADDRLLFGSGIAPEDLWFQQDGNDLRVTVLGTTDKAIFKDWYLDAAQEIDVFETNGGETLLNSDVAQLVTAMAVFDPGNGWDPTDTYDSTNLPTDVQTSITANWQSSP